MADSVRQQDVPGCSRATLRSKTEGVGSTAGGGSRECIGLIQHTDDDNGLRDVCRALQGGGTWRARNNSIPDESNLILNTLEDTEPSDEGERKEGDDEDGSLKAESEIHGENDVTGSGLTRFKRGNGSK